MALQQCLSVVHVAARLAIGVRVRRAKKSVRSLLTMPDDNSCPNNTDVVLVTGGSGFLGQHIISHLQTRAEHVREVRVLDLQPYTNKLGHTERRPVRSIVGCLTDLHTVRQACTGVSSVIHVAGLVSYGTFPDIRGMTLVNVQGTANLVSACLEAGVERLIFCSTVDVVVGYDDVVNGTEETSKIPDKFLFPGYPESKYRAECLVLGANGKQSPNGATFHTLSLRANVMYGEGDPYYVTSGLRSAQQAGGVLYRVGDGNALFQSAYVGNCAWAFVCADRALQRTPVLGGQFFYIPDDTPVQNTFDFMLPFLSTRGYTLSTNRLPFHLVYGLLYLAEFFLKLISPLIKVSLRTESYSVKYINMNIYFQGTKAKDDLKFFPIFTPEQSMRRSIEYYKHVKLF